MPYVDLDGIASYYEQHGDGEPVILLHGGYCSIETWDTQIEALSPRYRVHAPERPGHGRTRDREGPFTYEAMVSDTVAYLEAMDVGSAHVVGFSDGAIVGLMLALDHPERVRSLISISANLSPDGFADEDAIPSAESMGYENYDDDEAYARLSPDGAEHKDDLIAKLMKMWLNDPRIDSTELARINAPTLILAGDGDSIATSHTVLIAESIPGAQLCIIPNAGHLAMMQRPDLVNEVVLQFLASAR